MAAFLAFIAALMANPALIKELITVVTEIIGLFHAAPPAVQAQATAILSDPAKLTDLHTTLTQTRDMLKTLSTPPVA